MAMTAGLRSIAASRVPVGQSQVASSGVAPSSRARGAGTAWRRRHCRIAASTIRVSSGDGRSGGPRLDQLRAFSGQ